MYSAFLLIFMCLTTIALFVIMITSAMGAGKATDKTTCPGDPNDCQKQCHAYATWTAVGAGVAVALMIAVIIIYLYTNKTEVKQGFTEMGQYGTAKAGQLSDSAKASTAAALQQLAASMMQQPSSATGY